MNSFVPPGRISCMEALTQIYEESFPDHELPNSIDWIDALKREHQLAERLVHVINQLLAELYAEQRTAFYVTRYGEHTIEHHRFAQKGADLMLVKGEISWSTKGVAIGEHPKIFLSEKSSTEESDEVNSANSSRVEVRRGGRPSTGRDAALVYWSMFPHGHKAANLDWQNALFNVNVQLKRMGLEEVKQTSFKEHVNKLEPPK